MKSTVFWSLPFQTISVASVHQQISKVFLLSLETQDYHEGCSLKDAAQAVNFHFTF